MKPLEIAKKHLSAVLLSALAVILGVYVLVIDRHSITTDETEARKYLLLPAWRVDDVTRLDVELALPERAAEAYVLTRPTKAEDPERTWNLDASGIGYPAEEQVVDRMLSVFEYAKVLRTVPPGSVDRAAFGLDKPRVKIAIKMGDLSFKVSIGAVAPSQEGNYAEVEGRGVYLVTKAFAKSLEVPSDELRSKAFVPYLSTNLSALYIEGEGGVRKFERASWGGGRGSGFKFGEGSEGPKGLRVDGSRLDQVLVSFGQMQAESFLEKSVADAASKPKVTVTMVPKNGPNGVLAVGGECPSKPDLIVVVRREPSFLAACVPKSVLLPLVRPASDFEDDGIVGATVQEITELSITRGDKVLDIARTGPGFRVRKPNEAMIDAEVGNHLLSDLVEARGERAADDATIPAGEATTVRIVSQDGTTKDGKPVERVEDLEVGPETAEGKHLVIRKEDGAKLWLGAAAASAIRPSDLLLRDLQIVERKPMDLASMTIVAGGVTQSFTQSGPDVALTKPSGKGLTADKAFASRAIGAFVDMTAVRWVADEAEAAFGLAEPRFVVTAKLAPVDEKEKTIELKIGALTDDGVYASISEKKGVFLLPRTYEEVFDRNFVSRAAFDLDPGGSDKIVVEAGDASATLAREGRQLRWPGKSDALASSLEKELATLDALVAVETGEPSNDRGFDSPVMKIKITPRKSATDAEDPKTITYVFGSAGSAYGVPVRYARRDDVDATYAVPLEDIRRIEKLVSK